jgi:CheY-like chemotaxis protein
MPVLDGIEATRRLLHRGSSRPRGLLLTNKDHQEYL